MVSGLPWWQTVVTSMFMHASILHIAGNLLFLWIFGNNVEDAMGPVKFLGFYVLGGIAALALQTAVGPNSIAPTVGASGAIAAVLGGYIVLYPRARVLSLVFIILFFTVIELPALLMLGLWFAEQAVFGAAGLTSTSTGGVAYFAHVGGFVFGALTIRWLASRRKAVPPTRVLARPLMRTVLLVVVLVFIAGFGALTAIDISRYGLTGLDVLAILILILFSTGIVGALRHRPPDR